MPLFRSKDSKGSFYKAYAGSSHKYYYSPRSRSSRLRARNLARKQLAKIEIEKHKKA